MKEELAYVLVTPHSLRKSRTGGIISRLLSRTGLELVAGRMFAPSLELSESYAAMIGSQSNPRHQEVRQLIRDYVLRQIGPDLSGRRSRCLVLLFRGEAAIARVREVVGNIVTARTSGETVRDTYGDYITGSHGEVLHFEPAVLVGQDPDEVADHLRIWAEYSESDGARMDKVVEFPPKSNVEQTLVLLKPENLRAPAARPGGVIDLFSRTGLFIIAFRVLRMSPSRAMEFLRPQLPLLEREFGAMAGSRARTLLEREMGLGVEDATERALGSLLGPLLASKVWEDAVESLSGRRPAQCTEKEMTQPGPEQSIVLVYQGVDAINRVRAVVSPATGRESGAAPRLWPAFFSAEWESGAQRPPAHASESLEDARREIAIVGAWENNFKAEVEKSFLGL